MNEELKINSRPLRGGAGPRRPERRGPGGAGRLRQPLLGRGGLHPRPRGGPRRASPPSSPSARPRSTTPSTRRRGTSPATARDAGRWWWSPTGWTPRARRTPEEVLARSRALDVPIYAISAVSPLDDPESKLYVGRKVKGAAASGGEILERYATLSGGAAFRVSSYAGAQGGRRAHRERAQAPVPTGLRPPPGSGPLPPRRGAHDPQGRHGAHPQRLRALLTSSAPAGRA